MLNLGSLSNDNGNENVTTQDYEWLEKGKIPNESVFAVILGLKLVLIETIGHLSGRSFVATLNGLSSMIFLFM